MALFIKKILQKTLLNIPTESTPGHTCVYTALALPEASRRNSDQLCCTVLTVPLSVLIDW